MIIGSHQLIAVVAYLVLAGAGDKMQQCHALVAAWLGISDSCQTVQLEADSVASLSPVHVVTEGQDQLQHSSQSFAALNFFAGLENRQNFWFDFIVENVELFLVMQCPESLLIMGDPKKSEMKKLIILPIFMFSTHFDNSNKNLSALARWSISSACSSRRALSSGEGVNLSICSTMSTGNWSLASIVMIALETKIFNRGWKKNIKKVPKYLAHERGKIFGSRAESGRVVLHTIVLKLIVKGHDEVSKVPLFCDLFLCA